MEKHHYDDQGQPDFIAHTISGEARGALDTHRCCLDSKPRRWPHLDLNALPLVKDRVLHAAETSQRKRRSMSSRIFIQRFD